MNTQIKRSSSLSFLPTATQQQHFRFVNIDILWRRKSVIVCSCRYSILVVLHAGKLLNTFLHGSEGSFHGKSKQEEQLNHKRLMLSSSVSSRHALLLPLSEDRI